MSKYHRWNTIPALVLANIIVEQLKTHLIHVDIEPQPFAPKVNQVHHYIIEDEINMNFNWRVRISQQMHKGKRVINEYSAKTINCNIANIWS